MIQAITAQFSGSPRTYSYRVSPLEGAVLKVGDRVVVPNKLKDDGELSLSIARVVALLDEVPVEATAYIVQSLAPDLLHQATERAKATATA